MKRFLGIALLVLAMVSPASAGQWEYFTFDAASVGGINYAIAPGLSGYQFVPTGVAVLPKDTAVVLKAYSETGGSVLTASADTAGATTILIVNATTSDWGVATNLLYTIVDSTDPNDATVIFVGEVASTASTDGTNELITVAGNAAGTASGATLRKMSAISGDLLFGTEVDASPVIFTGSGPGTDGTYAAVASQIYDVTTLPAGRVGKDYAIGVTGNASTTTGVIYYMRGYYEKYK